MGVAEILGLVAVLLAMLVGLAGAVLPALPGPPVIFVAALGHKLVFGDRSVSWWILGVMLLMMLVSLLLDFIASSYGARHLGATWRGVVGAAVGAMLGLFWFPVGLILFPVAGAVLCEMAGGRAWREAGRAGAGAAIGMLAGAVGKVAFCLGMIGLFLLNVLFTLFRT